MKFIMKEEKYSISEKEKMMWDIDYDNHEDFEYKINAEPLQINITQECYRDQLVSFFQMAPLIKKTVRLEEADYILYANPYARIEDFSYDVLEDLERINRNRKKGAEIIIVGKATNIKTQIEGKYDNITYVDKHYTKYIGERFGLDIEDKYIVYDDRFEKLNIWPVDGCLNKCGFCRRTYMNIPFESIPIEELKKQLDWFKENHPEQMRYVSLRAENLTQYGLDIYGKQMLHKVIELIDSYDEIESIELPIGMCIGEITDEILEAICKCKKISLIGLNLEAGSDRLLKLVNKKHDRAKAINVCTAIREANPKVSIRSTIMIGLPTEGLEDILQLADLIIKCKVNYVHGNYYGYSPQHPIAKYQQINDKVRQLHLAYLIKLLKANYNPRLNNNFILQMRHEKIEDTSKRSVHREIERLKEEQKYHLPRLLRVTHENFVGGDISIKEETDNLGDAEEIMRKIKKITKAKRISR